MGSATIARPVPIVTNNSLRRIIIPPCNVVLEDGEGASGVPGGPAAKLPLPLRRRPRTRPARPPGLEKLQIRLENLHGKTYAEHGKIYRVSRASARVRQRTKRRRLAFQPAVGHDA